MGRFAVTPAELHGAAGTLGAVQGELGCPSLGADDFGSPELQAALSSFYRAADRVALAMGEAVARASTNLKAGAGAYVRTDVGAMLRGR